MRRATADTLHIPPWRGSPSLRLYIYRSAAPAPVLQSPGPPPGTQPQLGTKIPRERRRWRRRRRRRRSWTGQLLWLREPGLSGRTPWPQQVSQGVSEQLLLSRDVPASSSHVQTCTTSPVLSPGLHLNLPRTSPHGARIRPHASHLTSQRSPSG